MGPQCIIPPLALSLQLSWNTFFPLLSTFVISFLLLLARTLSLSFLCSRFYSLCAVYGAWLVDPFIFTQPPLCGRMLWRPPLFIVPSICGPHPSHLCSFLLSPNRGGCCTISPKKIPPPIRHPPEISPMRISVYYFDTKHPLVRIHTHISYNINSASTDNFLVNGKTE